MNGMAVTAPTAFMRRLFRAQGELCFHCDERMFLIVPKGMTRARGISREHVFPHSTTGRGLLNNIVLAHAGCNGERADRQPSAAEIARAATIYKRLKLEPFIPVAEFEARFGPVRKNRKRVSA